MAPRPFDPAFVYQPGRFNAILRERLREQRRERIAAGQCYICKRPPRPGRQTCEACAARAKILARRTRQKPENKAYNNAASRVYIRKKAKAGLCVNCLKPRVPGYTHCQAHVDYFREWAYWKSKVLRQQQGRKPNIRSNMTREEYQWLHEAKSRLQDMKKYLKARGMLPPTV